MPTVVIADDSPTLRRIVTSVLAREGFEVIAGEDGVEAVQAVFRVASRRGRPRRPDASCVWLCSRAAAEGRLADLATSRSCC